MVVVVVVTGVVVTDLELEDNFLFFLACVENISDSILTIKTVH